MTTDALGPMLALLLTSMNIVNIYWTWHRTRDQNSDAKAKAIAERFQLGSERMDRHDQRLSSMEQTLRTLPDKEHLHELQLAIAGLQGDLKAMTAVIDGNNKVMTRLESIVGRHEDHLLDGAKR